MTVKPLVLGTACVLLTACGMGASNLRPQGEVFAPCEKAHCVSSQQPGTRYAIEPLRYAGSREAAQAALLRVLAGMPGARIETASGDYVHATFTSPIMRYVDDLELRFAATEPVVHVRSSSRLGYYDFDVNRKRVEALRRSFAATQG
ncbi:DUF1499 domain-containing protein [Fontimonas sp. SYSU GA230001]|uniref:DUF1499 domain-containing protein n=1 Tax=Fontimonas sp. SYSU GA230001 TaxID=3142450 RepID=UPI0032B48277